MNQIFYKDTFRIKRGKLRLFEELPDFAKNNFLLIKKKLLEISNYTEKVYIHGSFCWGFWYEGSDFDIIITEKINEQEFKKFMLDTYDIKVDIFTFIPENELVEIP
jgi:hypothetical protein